VKVWSVAQQENYQPLSEDQQSRPVFEYENITLELDLPITPDYLTAHLPR
jgi:hypothetical protein